MFAQLRRDVGPELARIQSGLQACGFAITPIPERDAGVCDDARLRFAALCAVLEPLIDAEIVTDMAVAVDDRMQGQVADFAQRRNHPVRLVSLVSAGARIDEDDAGIDLDRASALPCAPRL